MTQATAYLLKRSVLVLLAMVLGMLAAVLVGCQGAAMHPEAQQVRVGQTAAQVRSELWEPTRVEGATWYYQRPFYTLAVPMEEGRVSREPVRLERQEDQDVTIAQYSSYLE